MTQIALFHSVLGVRPGVLGAAERLRAAGHEVEVVDQYDGRAFEDYASAGAFAESIGYPRLMERALAAVERLEDGFIAAGFSNGAGMAEHVATNRPVAGAVLLSGALPLAMIGAPEWPHGVPAQIHYSVHDPFRRQEAIDEVTASIRAAHGTVETFDYPGEGHLFTDASLPDEYDKESAEVLWGRVLGFCASHARHHGR